MQTRTNLVNAVLRELQREPATVDALVLKLGEPRDRVAKSVENLQRHGRIERAGLSRGNRAIYRLPIDNERMPRADVAAAWLFHEVGTEGKQGPAR